MEGALAAKGALAVKGPLPLNHGTSFAIADETFIPDALYQCKAITIK